MKTIFAVLLSAGISVNCLATEMHYVPQPTPIQTTDTGSGSSTNAPVIVGLALSSLVVYFIVRYHNKHKRVKARWEGQI